MLADGEKEVSSGVNVSVEMVDGEIRRFVLFGTTKDYPSREDIREMLKELNLISKLTS